ncbi:MAG TPA: CPBP family glutamic-type intramembrane protease [Rhizomicrobium sp.]|nr:CPBP family glutamic-type intramembrane protease [Rhizomicrobium sp.]
MLESAAKRSAWRALVAVTAIEGAAIAWSFHAASWQKILHYVFTPPGIPASWAAAAGVTVLYIAYAMRSLSFMRTYAFVPRRWREAIGLRLFAVPMALVTGFFEEAFFRRFIMDWFAQHGAGAAEQVGVSAVSFGLVHGVWALFGGFRAGLGATISTAVLGAMLAGTYLLGERALLPCAASHIAINLVLEPWLILAATSGRWGAAGAS